MEISDLQKYTGLLDKAGLMYFVRHQFVLSEDIEGTSVIIAEFDKDDDLLDITTEHNFKSLEEAMQLWRDT
jgi:hypothetical protein